MPGDYPPRPKKGDEDLQSIRHGSIEEQLGALNGRLDGVSDGVDTPAGGGGSIPEKAPEPETQHVPAGPAQARMEALNRLHKRAAETSQQVPEAAVEQVADTDEEPVSVETESAAMAQAIDQLYFPVAEEIRRNEGVQPADIPEAWNEIYRAFVNLKKIREDFIKATDDSQRIAIINRFNEKLHTFEDEIAPRVRMEAARFAASRPQPPDIHSERIEALHAAVEAVTASPAEPEVVAPEVETSAMPPEEPEIIPVPEDAPAPKTKRQSKAARDERIRAIRAELIDIESQLKNSRSGGLEERGVLLEEELRKLESAGKRKKKTEAGEAPSVPVFEPRTKIERMALRTRGQEAMQERSEKVGSGPRTSKEVAKASEPFAEKMYEAEREYFDALKQHHANRGDVSVALEEMVGHALPKDVQQLKEKWIASRAAYGSFLKQSSAERFVKKHGSRTSKHGFSEKEVLNRYNRVVTAREIVLGAEEAEQRAQMAGLSERERGFIGGAFDAYKKLPPGVRIFATGAVFSSIGLATGGIALAAAPAALLLGRAGLAQWAHSRKGNIDGTAASAAKFVIGIAAIGGALAGEYGTRAFHQVAGTKRKAGVWLNEREFAQNDKLLSGKKIRAEWGAKEKIARADLADVEQLKQISKQRGKALRVDERIARQSRWGRLLGGLFGGVAGGQLAHSWFGGETQATDASDTHSELPPLTDKELSGITEIKPLDGETPAFNPPGYAPIFPESHGPFTASSEGFVMPSAEGVDHVQHMTPPEAVPSTSSVPSTETVATEPVGGFNEIAMIDHPNQGMDHLFTSLKHQLHEGTDPSKLSPVAAHILKLTPSQLSHEVHAAVGEHYGGESLTMHKGDQLFLDDKDNLWFQPNGHDPVLVMHNDPSVTDAAHPGVALNQIEGHMQAIHAPVHHTQEAAHAPASQTEHTPEAAGTPMETETIAHATANQETYETRPAHDINPSEFQPVIQPHFVNAHHVEVNPQEAKFYSWKLPHSKEVFPLVTGGTAEAREHLILQFLTRHPELKHVLTVVENSKTHAQEVREYALDGRGHLYTPTDAAIDIRTHQPLPIPDPNDYIASPAL